ncbi:hypothetical protein [Devosia soli]|uniref:hypothetical protein n=1 Tax=Devosia soli TaxID=361041 RepID=UPI00069B37B4|nr:hypothetical protein [Devosia soli]
MLKKLITGSVLLALGTGTALADGKVYVQLPDLSSYTDHRAEEFLEAVVMANVVSSNCEGFGITDAEWSLLTDSADILAYGQLKLSTDDYDTYFYKPAFDALDKPGTCEEKGPGVEQVLSELVFQGGSREPLPDQEAAYKEWQVFMDDLQNNAEPASSGKTKTK